MAARSSSSGANLSPLDGIRSLELVLNERRLLLRTGGLAPLVVAELGESVPEVFSGLLRARTADGSWEIRAEREQHGWRVAGYAAGAAEPSAWFSPRWRSLLRGGSIQTVGAQYRLAPSLLGTWRMRDRRHKHLLTIRPGKYLRLAVTLREDSGISASPLVLLLAVQVVVLDSGTP
jgi:hypothetical protein